MAPYLPSTCRQLNGATSISPSSAPMKKGTVIVWLALLFSGIIALFWRNEWMYSLPTPVPANYHAVEQGRTIELPRQLRYKNSKPVFLHFFNPRCPCSRFNMDHFKSLVRQYGDKVNFNIVVLSNKSYTEKEIQGKYDLSIPVLFDTAIATTCGVYSTPQAVIIDGREKLYYRGNYNRARYCTDKNTEYARIALTTLLSQQPPTNFDKYATTAYGCQLPTCNKE